MIKLVFCHNHAFTYTITVGPPGFGGGGIEGGGTISGPGGRGGTTSGGRGGTTSGPGIGVSGPGGESGGFGASGFGPGFGTGSGGDGSVVISGGTPGSVSGPGFGTTKGTSLGDAEAPFSAQRGSPGEPFPGNRAGHNREYDPTETEDSRCECGGCK
ncbi:uncharacterized protein G2W53_039084 [Senna tora]|uniref:Uncharacterized protein n=1 Tax=Senna tora TaxID=362788 RepID=A0A834SQ49_9FABA|nr:uncharacterized protein G2W53_039084 [Senna tora]